LKLYIFYRQGVLEILAIAVNIANTFIMMVALELPIFAVFVLANSYGAILESLVKLRQETKFILVGGYINIEFGYKIKVYRYNMSVIITFLLLLFFLIGSIFLYNINEWIYFATASAVCATLTSYRSTVFSIKGDHIASTAYAIKVNSAILMGNSLVIFLTTEISVALLLTIKLVITIMVFLLTVDSVIISSLKYITRNMTLSYFLRRLHKVDLAYYVSSVNLSMLIALPTILIEQVMGQKILNGIVIVKGVLDTVYKLFPAICTPYILNGRLLTSEVLARSAAGKIMCKKNIYFVFSFCGFFLVMGLFSYQILPIVLLILKKEQLTDFYPSLIRLSMLVSLTLVSFNLFVREQPRHLIASKSTVACLIFICATFLMYALNINLIDSLNFGYLFVNAYLFKTVYLKYKTY
jgi:hypothetical protein